MSQLENFSQQDEEVRLMLNRKNKVAELKLKSEGHLKQSINAIANSPSRKLKNSSPSRSPTKSPTK